MTRKIMVLGANAGQADLIRHAKARGWKVVGCALSSNEPGATPCDVFEEADITDLVLLEKIACRHKVDLIYSVSSDVAIRSVVSLSERLGLPHFFNSSFIELLDEKALLREFLESHNLNGVRYRRVAKTSDVEGWDDFPCVVKPVDAQGQRGINLIEDAHGLPDAVSHAIALSRTGQAIIESYLGGVEVSCNALLSGGEAKIKVLSQRLVHGVTALGVPRGHLIPVANLGAAEKEAALALVDSIVLAMGQSAGPLYFQMIATDKGPKVVEIAPRLDGCHMWRLIEAAYQVNIMEATIDCLIGKAIDAVELTPDSQVIPMELMFQQAPPGSRFDSSKFPAPLNASHHEYRYQDGDIVQPVNGVLEVVGYHVGPRA